MPIKLKKLPVEESKEYCLKSPNRYAENLLQILLGLLRISKENYLPQKMNLNKDGLSTSKNFWTDQDLMIIDIPDIGNADEELDINLELEV